jgi:putative membrane protein
VIIGFITGSLGVVWPWKEKIFKVNKEGKVLVDRHGNKILDNYDRYFPDFSITETWIAILFIAIGVSIVLGLAWYENRNKPA